MSRWFACLGGILACYLGCCADMCFLDGILVCDAGTRYNIQEGKRGGLGFV